MAVPNLLNDAWETWDIPGHAVTVEKAAGIIAKKMYHRGDRVVARDLFDLALVIEREPHSLRPAAPFLLRHREAFLKQICNPHPSLPVAFDDIAALTYTQSFGRCVEVAGGFLEALPQSSILFLRFA